MHKHKEKIFIAILRVDIYDGSLFLDNADFINHYFITQVVHKDSDGYLDSDSQQLIAQLAKQNTCDPWEQPSALGDYPQGKVCNSKPTIIEAEASIMLAGQVPSDFV